VAFPDRIERTVELAHPPSAVWAALTTAEGLSAWFGKEATIDLRPGGSARMSWDNGHIADMRVERVEEPRLFGYTCTSTGFPMTIRAAPTLSSRWSRLVRARGLTVVESGFAQLPEDAHRTAHGGNTQGWARRAR